MTSRRACIAFCLLICTACSTTTWWKFHGNLANNGSGIAGGTNTGKMLWAFPTGGPIWGAPALSADEKTLYFGSGDQNVYAVTTGGTLAWKFPAHGQVTSSPAVDQGVIFVGSHDHSLYAITSKGLPRWFFQTKGEIHSSPAVSRGMVYVGSSDHNVYAVEEASGLQKWMHSTGNEVRSFQVGKERPRLHSRPPSGACYCAARQRSACVCRPADAGRSTAIAGGGIARRVAPRADQAPAA